MSDDTHKDSDYLGLNEAVDSMLDSEHFHAYQERHGIKSLPTLTVANDEVADSIVSWLRPRLEGKTVVEIGGGIGLLSLHMGFIAKRVFCIEANPMWATAFTAALLVAKPPNVSYLFGGAEEFEGIIKADVAVFCTHSGVSPMANLAAKFAPVVIDVYSELIAQNPDAFDRRARELRKFV